MCSNCVLSHHIGEPVCDAIHDFLVQCASWTSWTRWVRWASGVDHAGRGSQACLLDQVVMCLLHHLFVFFWVGILYHIGQVHVSVRRRMCLACLAWWANLCATWAIATSCMAHKILFSSVGVRDQHLLPLPHGTNSQALYLLFAMLNILYASASSIILAHNQTDKCQASADCLFC